MPTREEFARQMRKRKTSVADVDTGGVASPVSTAKRKVNTEKLAARVRIVGNTLFKDESFTTPAEMIGNVRDFVTTRIPALDVLLTRTVGKGIALGRITEILGDADVGKTTLGCYLMRSIQEFGGIGVIIDTESTLTEARLKGLGIDTSSLVVIQDAVIESILEKIPVVIKELKGTPGLICWDTIAATRSRRDKGRKIGEGAIGIHAKVLSEGFRMLTPQLAKQNVALVCCNQRKQGGIAQMFTSSRARDTSLGGEAIKFHPSHRLRLKFSKQTDGGFIVAAKAVKNKFAPSELQVPLIFRVAGDIPEFDVHATTVETIRKWVGTTARILYTSSSTGKKYTEKMLLTALAENASEAQEVYTFLEEAHARSTVGG
jgi:RecA/RadA recombinase